MSKTKLILPLLIVAPVIFACNKGVTGKYKYNNNEISYTTGSKDSFKDFDSDNFFKDEGSFIDTVVTKLQTDNKGEKQDCLTFSYVDITNPVEDEQKNPVSNFGVLNDRDVSEMEKTYTCHYGQAKGQWHLYKTSVSEEGKIIASRHIICSNWAEHSTTGYFAYQVKDQELKFNGSSLKIVCDFDFTHDEVSTIKGVLTLNYSKI